MPDGITGPLTETETHQALDIAHQLIRAGIPVFAAPPCAPGCGMANHPKALHHYRLPNFWQKTVPSKVWIEERWRPGYGLGAVGGHVADFLDTDPRNGGNESEKELRTAGHWPLTFGRQLTPGGGTHDIISATGQRELHSFVPGIDLQAGQPDGQGRGFIWISPTVRQSKDPARLGEMIPYRWEVEPDLDLLMEYRTDAGEVTDPSIEGIVARVHAKRSPVPTQRGRITVSATSEDDPFLTASDLRGAAREERAFTRAQAQDFLRPYLQEVQRAQVGSIEAAANNAAVALSHFTPDFWSVDQGMKLLTDSLAHTAYDPSGPYASWTAEKFRAVLDGRRPALDPWRATLRPELDRSLFDPDARPETVAPPATAEEATSLVDRLIAELLTVDQVIQRPAPRPLIWGILDRDSEAWLIGPPGSRKSFVALSMARSVAAGDPWQGHRVEQGLVVYIVAEGASGFSLRVRASQQAHGPIGDQLLILPRPVQAKDYVAWEVLVAACRKLQPALVILDTQARVTVGLEENSATDMGIYVNAISRIREATGACVLTVHHSGRNGQDARGSSAIDGAQGTELRVAAIGQKGELRGELYMDKQKDMAETEGGIPLAFERVDLEEDPETGRPLSSLVLADPDPFLTAEGVDGDLTRPWMPTFHHRDRWKRTILNALWDFAPVDYGITKAEVKAILVRDAGLPRQSSQFDDAWKAVVELRDAAGDPVVISTGGARYDLGSLTFLAAMEEEHGPRGGTPSAREGPPTGSEGWSLSV